MIGFKKLNGAAINWLLLPSLLALDQASKVWVERTLELGEKWPIIPGLFNLTRVHNYGIAFGLFQGYGNWVAIAAFLIFCGVLFWIWRKVDWSSWSNNMIAALILSGAVGNWIDRARLGYVIDFADFHIGPHHWPAFNVADSCVCIAIGWLMLLIFKGKDS